MEDDVVVVKPSREEMALRILLAFIESPRIPDQTLATAIATSVTAADYLIEELRVAQDKE